MTERTWGFLAVIGIAVVGGGLTVLASTIGPTGSPAGNYQAFSHGENYTWVSGELRRSDLEGGFWQIIYLREGVEPDQYGGRFTLGTAPLLDEFEAGDRVVIFGRIAREQASIFQSGTIYEIDRVQRL